MRVEKGTATPEKWARQTRRERKKAQWLPAKGPDSHKREHLLSPGRGQGPGTQGAEEEEEGGSGALSNPAHFLPSLPPVLKHPPPWACDWGVPEVSAKGLLAAPSPCNLHLSPPPPFLALHPFPGRADRPSPAGSQGPNKARPVPCPASVGVMSGLGRR